MVSNKQAGASTVVIYQISDFNARLAFMSIALQQRKTWNELN